MQLFYYNYHWNAVSGAFSNAKIFLHWYLDAYHGDNLFSIPAAHNGIYLIWAGIARTAFPWTA